jgi:predicted MFS family arabinose efflux permease
VSQSPDADTRFKSARYALAVLLAVYVLSFLDRQVIVILAEGIKKDLGLSDTQVGLMAGLAFALLYTLLGLPLARLADHPRTNRVGLIALCVGAWSLMTALCGLANNFTQLLLARVGVGIGEAGGTPAAHALIGEMVEPAKRSSALAIYGMGIPLGSLLGLVLGGFLADKIGWRATFLTLGAPGVLVALLLVLTVKDPRRTGVQSVQAAPAAEPLKTTLGLLLASPAFVLLLAAATVVSFLGYGKGVWTAAFYMRSHHLSAGQVGLWLGLSSGLAGVFGTWLGGALAERFGRRSPRHILTARARRPRGSDRRGPAARHRPARRQHRRVRGQFTGLCGRVRRRDPVRRRRFAPGHLLDRRPDRTDARRLRRAFAFRRWRGCGGLGRIDRSANQDCRPGRRRPPSAVRGLDRAARGATRPGGHRS